MEKLKMHEYSLDETFKNFNDIISTCREVSGFKVSPCIIFIHTRL